VHEVAPTAANATMHASRTVASWVADVGGGRVALDFSGELLSLEHVRGPWPEAHGLLCGLGMVLVGQVVVLAYYVVRRALGAKTIQLKSPPGSTLAADLWAHASQPESFGMVYGYLTAVWMLRLMPPAYYDTTARVNWLHVLAQFLVVDAFTFAAHLLEHNWWALYRIAHKPHHKWINPRLYNAFNGSPMDTLTLILLPLLATHQVCFFVRTWSFIAFGTLYAAWFTLIHCEFRHPWDPLFELIGFGTAEDHNVHHLLFRYNYGHFFTYCDRIAGTYKSAHTVNKYRTFYSYNHLTWNGDADADAATTAAAAADGAKRADASSRIAAAVAKKAQ